MKQGQKSRDIPYSPPQGPTLIERQGVGLGGTNFGNTGSQGKSSLTSETSGSPGIGGDIFSDGLDNDDVGLREDD